MLPHDLENVRDSLSTPGDGPSSHAGRICIGEEGEGEENEGGRQSQTYIYIFVLYVHTYTENYVFYVYMHICTWKLCIL
jgi:hypothetical protein